VGTFGRFLDLPESRSTVSRGLRDQSIAAPVPGLGDLLGRRPYADLTPCASSPRRPAIFVTGRFRSGSTLVWNLFRHTPGVVAYYEPLNERRWFDPARRSAGTDPTHLGVSNYWAEYDGLEELAGVYDEAWTHRQLYMTADAWAPGLKQYIDVLIRRAEGIPVLQFNRVDFRLPWLRRHYPDARLVHVYRHPRDQWLSTLGRARPDMRDLRLATYQPYDGFYLESWGRDLSLVFPFLATAPNDHPYELFFQIWRLSYLFGMEYAHGSISYEDLLADPRASVTRLMTLSGLPQYPLDTLTGLIEPVGVGKWASLPGAEVLPQIEARVEATLREYFGATAVVSQAIG
jgi:hypothetical protein